MIDWFTRSVSQVSSVALFSWSWTFLVMRSWNQFAFAIAFWTASRKLPEPLSEIAIRGTVTSKLVSVICRLVFGDTPTTWIVPESFALGTLNVSTKPP